MPSSSIYPLSITPHFSRATLLVSLQYDCSVSHTGSLCLSQTRTSQDNAVELTRATVFLFEPTVLYAGERVGGRQRQRQDREERANPFKLQELSCIWTGHVWLQRMNFDGKWERRRMIEVELGGVNV